MTNRGGQVVEESEAGGGLDSAVRPMRATISMMETRLATFKKALEGFAHRPAWLATTLA
jgi:hypothetical protein